MINKYFLKNPKLTKENVSIYVYIPYLSLLSYVFLKKYLITL